jgi:cytochrome c oxidase assembly protein subunit 15
MKNRAVTTWLAVCAAMVFSMIVAGGITRVSRAGLSITTWDPILGALPPLSHDAWRNAFERYRVSPEGMLVNHGIAFEDFRRLCLVEWGHRLLARVTGLVFVVPFVWFIVRRQLTWQRARSLVAIFVVGLAQGVMGWLMVASGLVSAPHVSPFRLAGHLLLAVGLLAALVWSALDPPRAMRSRATAFALVSAVVTIALGALMAGLHAGLVCSTFPTMNGAWIPEGLHVGYDAWTIHFAHRAAALVTASAALFAAARAWRRSTGLSIAVAASISTQIALGALVVARHVPAALAVTHQASGALLVVLLVALHGSSVVRSSRIRPRHDVSHGQAPGPTPRSSHAPHDSYEPAPASAHRRAGGSAPRVSRPLAPFLRALARAGDARRHRRRTNS